MSEPHEVADSIEKVVEGVYHWRIRNSLIGGAISSSHASWAAGTSSEENGSLLRGSTA